MKGKGFAFLSHYDFNLYRFRGALMRALVQRGARVYAIAPPGPYAAKFREMGVEFVPFPLDRLTFNPLKAWRSVCRLTELLEGLEPDLIQTFTLRPNVYGGLAGARAGVPALVCTVTGLGTLYTEDGLKTRAYRWAAEVVTGYALKRAQAVVFQNPDDLVYYLQKGLCRPEQARLIPGSGVDTEEFNPERFPPERRRELRARWGLPGDVVVVLMIARLIAPKGVYEFLEAARRLRGRAYFVLVGEPDPGNPASLTPQEIKGLQREGVVLLPGWQTHIAEWLAMADLYVLPSYREGMPRTVLEAMAMGLPVVATDVPGCREVIQHEETGFLVPPRNVDALTNAINTLIEDADLRQRLGQRCRGRVVERFSTERIVEEHLKLYGTLLCSEDIASIAGEQEAGLRQGD